MPWLAWLLVSTASPLRLTGVPLTASVATPVTPLPTRSTPGARVIELPATVPMAEREPAVLPLLVADSELLDTTNGALSDVGVATRLVMSALMVELLMYAVGSLPAPVVSTLACALLTATPPWSTVPPPALAVNRLVASLPP